MEQKYYSTYASSNFNHLSPDSLTFSENIQWNKKRKKLKG